MDEGHRQILNISIRPIGDSLKEVVSLFEFISFTHVYREHNVEVDVILKRDNKYPKGS